MPSLFKLLFVVGILASITYGMMFALTHYVEPKQREVTIRVPTELLYRDQ